MALCVERVKHIKPKVIFSFLFLVYQAWTS